MSPRKSYSNGSTQSCRFNDCNNMAIIGTDKCSFHKNRRQCIIDECTNQVYARKLCVRHGGKKQCQADGCKAHARGGGYCLQHGGFSVKRFCTVDGCKKQAHARQKCVRHGGGRRCRINGCMQHARAGGICNRHSHDHKCRIDGCMKVAQHLGSICFHHAMELRAEGKIAFQDNLGETTHFMHKKKKVDITQKMLELPDPSPEHPAQSIWARNDCFHQQYYPNTSVNVPDTTCRKESSRPERGMWSEPLLPSMGKIATSSNLISPLLSSSLISKLRSSQPKNSTEGYPTESHHCANYEPSPAYSVGDSTGSHYHKKSGEDDLEYILNSYSKLISPAAMSYPEHTSRNLFPGIPHSSPSLHTTNEKDIVETPTTSAPPLVRLNSLLPPAPGIITGQIPRSHHYG